MLPALPVARGPPGSLAGLQTCTKPRCGPRHDEPVAFFVIPQVYPRGSLLWKRPTMSLGLLSQLHSTQPVLPFWGISGYHRLHHKTRHIILRRRIQLLSPFFLFLAPFCSCPEALWGHTQQGRGETVSSLREQDEPSTMSIWKLGQKSQNLKFIAGCWKRSSCDKDVGQNICLLWVSRHHRQPPVPAPSLPGWAAWGWLPARPLGHAPTTGFSGGWRNHSPSRNRRKVHHGILPTRGGNDGSCWAQRSCAAFEQPGTQPAGSHFYGRSQETGVNVLG